MGGYSTKIRRKLSLFDLNIWNCYEIHYHLLRTNNFLETFCNTFQKTLSLVHTDIFSLLDALKNKQSLRY